MQLLKLKDDMKKLTSLDPEASAMQSANAKQLKDKVLELKKDPKALKTLMKNEAKKKAARILKDKVQISEDEEEALESAKHLKNKMVKLKNSHDLKQELKGGAKKQAAATLTKELEKEGKMMSTAKQLEKDMKEMEKISLTNTKEGHASQPKENSPVKKAVPKKKKKKKAPKKKKRL